MAKFIAFDLGAESGRAVLAVLKGRQITLEVKHRFANPVGRLNGHLHWDFLLQWEEMKKGLHLAAAGQKKIDGAGVDTWGVDFGLIDKAGSLLGFPYHYRDCRTNGEMNRAFKKISRKAIFETTGIQFLPFNTIFQLTAMQRMQPDVLDAAQKLLFMPDLFNYFFTGVARNEFSIATTSQMYDPRKNKWATPMLNRLGIPGRLLQKIVPSGTTLGPLKKEIAEECGIGPMQIIAPACHDTASAVAAVPADVDNFCYISSGTWSLMGVELTDPIINDQTLALNYTNEGGAGGRIRLLKNIMGLWLVQECRRQFLAEGHDYSYAELTDLARRANPRRSLIDPDAAEFLAPGRMCDKIQNFCRQTRQPIPSSPGEMIRTCLDSLAMVYRKTLDGLEKILGRRISVIHIVGGGSQNELLNQLTADACNRPVIAGPIEATAIGNALVQAMAIGVIGSLEQARKIVRLSFPVKEYEPIDPEPWEARIPF